MGVVAYAGWNSVCIAAAMLGGPVPVSSARARRMHTGVPGRTEGGYRDVSGVELMLFS